MRITELFNTRSIALDSTAADQAQIIDELGELQATHGNLTDKAAYKAAIYEREAEAMWITATVPHARPRRLRDLPQPGRHAAEDPRAVQCR